MPNGRVKKWSRSGYLKRWNIAAFFLHLASFIAALIVTIVFREESLLRELTTDFLLYDAGTLNPPQLGPFTVMLRSLGFYQISWVVIVFPFVTALFHGFIAWNKQLNKMYNRWALLEGRNPIRWIEYSITATLMVWVIAQVSGITNIFLLLLLSLINIAMQSQGYLMEVLNLGFEETKKVNWVPTLIGFLVFIVQWVPIFGYFFAAVTSNPNVPWFVYVIVIGLFDLFLLFGLVMVLHYTNSKSRFVRWFRDNYNNEKAYIILSFISKFFLDWSLIIGITTSQINA